MTDAEGSGEWTTEDSADSGPVKILVDSHWSMAEDPTETKCCVDVCDGMMFEIAW